MSKAAALGAGVLSLSMVQGLAAASPAPATTQLAGTGATPAALAHPAGSVAAATPVSFEVSLVERDAAGAAALVRAVSDPTSSQYRHYLTAAQWEAQFSPTASTVASVVSWLKGAGLTVGTVTADRLTIPVSGTAAVVQKSLGVSLGTYDVAGTDLREAAGDIKVPTGLAGAILGARGLSQVLATSNATADGGAAESAASAATPAATPDFPAPPGAFVTAPPCSTYYGQTTTTTGFGDQYPGYADTLPDTVCGYVPSQLRSAYDVPAADTGKGATIAVVDAYDSATTASDLTKYFATNDPSAPVKASTLQQVDMNPFNDQSVCAASGWQDEEAIDLDSSHGLAPDAHVLYVGAKNCENGLFDADQYIIDGGLANVITNSFGDTGGDLFDSASNRAANDQIFEMADVTGITVQFSSGDDGDNYDLLGTSAADYPASSPYVTAVGGTTLQIGADGAQTGQLGWSTGKSVECDKRLIGVFAGCKASTVGNFLPPAFDGASGGFTSYSYAEPYYQQGVVPAALADRNDAVTGGANRVLPDISLDADPATGLLIGLHETFNDGRVAYGQTRYGGTSLASPILAGIVADIDGASVQPVGFLNPTIYKLDQTTKGAIEDILTGGDQAQYRNDYAAQLYGPGEASLGVIHSVREIAFAGKESFCDSSGNCESRPDTQSVTPGYDSLTGIGAPGADFVTDLAK